MPFVLHVDVDACFAQVEQLRDPSLRGKAVAVQQHQDIIAANALAKAAGVAKHMSPAEARRLLAPVGGRVVHVFTAEGGRISYQPYREASARLLRLLHALPWAAVVEKASIDEAYVLLRGGPPAGAAPLVGAAAAAAAAAGEDPWEEEDGEEAGAAAQAALQRALDVKVAVLQQLGLTVSVGAAPNRLMAKLASAAAKPDGVRLLADRRSSLALLAQTPARRLPGYGGKAAEAFEQHGIGAATDLQRFTQQQLEGMLGCKPAAAAQLSQWCRGLDDTPVQDRGPPKSLSVQMSLTPQLLPMHPSQGLTVSAAGGRAGVLEPLVTGRPDFRLRVRQLMAAMGGDLLQRVQEDRAEEGRWPRTLSASLRAFGAGRDQSFTTRSTSFPALGLQQARPALPARQPASAEQPQQVQQQPAQEARQQPASAAAGGQRQLAPLEEAVVSALESLLHQVAATYPPTATVVELRLAATNFHSAATAAAAAPISRYFAAAPRGEAAAAGGEAQQQAQQQQQQQQQQQRRRQHQQQQEQAHAGEDQPPPPQEQQPVETTQVAAGGCAAGAADDGGIDLGGIDVREQQRILQQIEAERRAQQQQQPAGGGGRKRGAGKPPPGPDPKQRSIASFLRK